QYMIKANHGCAWNIMGSKGQLHRYADGRAFVDPACAGAGAGSAAGAPLSREDAVALCQEWLRRHYSQREWAYTQIPPKILVEGWLTPSGGPKAPRLDDRLYTFNGEVKAVSLGSAQ